ncbi:hypothetical protein L3X38_043660 [Prunus dulcis]|uniref:Uncharacterized protein n=1 Tax=Prunus dulcis TaxID=3755 RepID=A0AAD4YMP8_PRUDU|nr:hypothetical protein L3X38_043660 [Prunus dulcis]
MLVGRHPNFLQFVSSILTRLKRNSTDEGSSLIFVPFNERNFEFPRGSKISGKYLNFEQPSRSRFIRDLNLQMVDGRLTNLLQSSSRIVLRPKRYSIDEGNISIFAPIISNTVRSLGSSENLPRHEQPSRLKPEGSFSLQLLSKKSFRETKLMKAIPLLQL